MLERWPRRDARLESIRPRSAGPAAALERIRARPEGSFYLHGYYSSGKTHLMIAQYRAVALAGVPCLLRSSRELADEMRKAQAAPAAGEA